LPDFNSHISQAKKNLAFLGRINSSIEDCEDWQVTISFYVAVHLVNAHLSNFHLQYRTHVDVDRLISPDSTIVETRLPEDIYLAYNKLQTLSRRSRYLTDNSNPGNTYACTTTIKHLTKALKNLDTILTHFAGLYDIDFSFILVIGTNLRDTDKLDYFQKSD
jgi:hypothetical protein